MLTTYTHDRDMIEASSNGANSYVSKPVDFVEFLEAAKILGLHWALMNKSVVSVP